MQEIAKRPYYQKTIQRRKQETQTLNQTVFSSDFGRINRRRSDNVLNTKIKLCLRFVLRLERRKPQEIQAHLISEI